MATVKGIWVMTPYMFPNSNWNVNFSSNGNNYTSITVTTGLRIKYGDTTAYSSPTWSNKAFSVIDFGSTEQEVDSSFYEWLIENAMEGGITFDLRVLGLAEGVHSVAVRAEAREYMDSSDSNVVSYEVIEDELAGTWMFNDTVSLLSDGTVFFFDYVLPNSSAPFQLRYGLRFANNSRYKEIYALSRDGGNWYTVYDANDGSWYSTTNQTILIMSKLAEVTNGSSLLSWLKANATKQS